MADYFVASGGSNTAPYDTWAKAATSLATALAAATASGDRVIIQYNAVPSVDAEVGIDKTYTFVESVEFISAQNDGGSAFTPTKMDTTYWIGNSTTNRSITLTCSTSGKKVRIFGVTFRTAGSTSDQIIIGTSAEGTHIELEQCYLWNGNTATTSRIKIGTGNAVYVKLSHCVLRFGSTSQGITLQSGRLEMFSCSVASAGSIPSVFVIPYGSPINVYADDCDFSSIVGTILGDATANQITLVFSRCKLGSGFTALATQTQPSKASGNVTLYDCASDDTHYGFGYYDALGALTAYTSIYASGGPTYDGTNPFSWRIDTSAYASFIAPFVTPWISTYHNGTSAITPRMEILRDGSATAYKDDQVWGEFSAKVTSGSVNGTLQTDRRGLAAAAADQAAGMGTGSWTGEGGTAWSGKIDSGSSMTPAEIGELKARVYVGVASATVYVDPQIRTA